MHQHLSNQELARIRYAEVLREASRRYAPREAAEPSEQPASARRRGLRLLLARVHLGRAAAA